MRFLSTPESAERLEPSVLAILETLASTALWISVALWLNSSRHISVAIVLAPLMLFRTAESMQLGFDWIRRWLAWVDRRRSGRVFLAVGLLAPAALVIRVISTVVATRRHPLEALRSAPANWTRQAICIDFSQPPEFLPGEATQGDTPAFAMFARGIRLVRSRPKRLLALVVFVATFLPPALYRVTFKATAIVYAPFIWVIQSTLHQTLSTADRLERLRKGEIEKVRRKWSLLALSLLVTKTGVLLGWLRLDQLKSVIPSPQVLSAFVVPDHLPLWQIAVGVNCVLTFLLLWLADAASPRLASGLWPEIPVARAITALSFTRGVLSLFSVGAGFAIALRELWPAL